MNFLKRAIVSIKRRPGKTVILMLLVFILGNIISGAISIQRAVENTETNLKRNLPAVATVDQDMQAMWDYELTTGDWPMLEMISAQTLRQIGELPYVRAFDLSVTAWQLFSSDLERVWSPELEEMGWTDWQSLPEIDGLVQISLTGVENPELIDVQENIIEIVSGRTFTEAEMGNRNNPTQVAIVSRSFADLNNLAVGSTFTVDNTIYDESDLGPNDMWGSHFTEDNVFARESYELTIVGIFEPLVEANTGDEYWDKEQINNLHNRIYVPNAVAEAAVLYRNEQSREMWGDEGGVVNPDADGDEEDNFWFDPIYVLYDPTDLGAFADAANELLPDFWVISDLSNTFAHIATSMETMSWLASIVLWVAVGATLLILSLLITLFLRDRKHEIGIYLALGEKKRKVATQIILEVATVSVLAITLSLFSGNLLASNMSESMLRDNIISAQQDDMWGMSTSIGGTLGWHSDGDMSLEEMMASYDVSLDGTTIVLFYGVGIGAILVSTVVPIAYIMRLDPKKIMM